MNRLLRVPGLLIMLLLFSVSLVKADVAPICFSLDDSGQQHIDSRCKNQKPSQDTPETGVRPISKPVFVELSSTLLLLYGTTQILESGIFYLAGLRSKKTFILLLLVNTLTFFSLSQFMYLVSNFLPVGFVSLPSTYAIFILAEVFVALFEGLVLSIFLKEYARKHVFLTTVLANFIGTLVALVFAFGNIR